MRLILLALTMSLGGCGTITTLADTDGVVSTRLSKSECSEIQYIYSGVIYDFCVLNGTASAPSTVSDTDRPSSNKYAVMFIAAEMVVSTVADTVMLPYTIYRQSNGDYIRVED